MLKHKQSKSASLADVFTLDIETDAQGEVIDIGFYNGIDCRYFSDWSAFLTHLDSIETPSLIYAHNGGGFDYVNLLMYAFKHNIKFSAMLKQSKIFAFTFHNRPHIKFVDSFTLLPMSLDKITRSFSEFEKIEIDESNYMDMRAFKNREQKLYYQYLERDCISLYQAIIKLRAIVNDVHFLGNLPLSIGGISMRLYTKRFLPVKIITPSALEKEFTFRGYVGGRCEYLGYGKESANGWYENANGYDFNSHYPAQMIKHEFPIIRGIPTNKAIYKGDLIAPGIYYATVAQKGGRIPLLKNEIGDYSMEVQGVYTYLELNEIIKQGGIVKIENGYHYEHTAPIFNNFVEFFFNERMKAQNISDDARNVFYKLALNNLYGKFGQRDSVESLEVFSEKQARDKMQSAEINEFYRIDDNFAFYEVKQEKKCFTSFPAIASMITASARLHLCQVLESCEYPIYCDTDSIHCQDVLDRSMTGDDLGKLKIEFLNCNARYGGKKSYEIEHEKFRQKGIPKKQVNGQFFDALFKHGRNAVSYKRPLLLKSAIRKQDVSPSKFIEFERTIQREKSLRERLTSD